MKLIILIGALLANMAYSQVDGITYDWKMKRDKDNIKIFTSKVPDSKFEAVRAEMRIKGSLHSLVGLVSDSAACPSWADLCKEEKVIETISETESYVYTYNDIPFPVKDRDVLAHVVWQYIPEKRKVSMTSIATTGRFKKTKAIRIEKAIAHWHFTELENGEVLVENFAHIDPNGPTPAWITNMMLVSSPFKTLVNMRKAIQSGKYDQHKFDFIKNL